MGRIKTPAVLAAVLTLLTIICVLPAANAQQGKDSYFKRNSYQRIHLGIFSSYFADNIRIMTFGYDYGLKLIWINGNFNLIDFGFGANGILAFDQRHDPDRDRPNYARVVPGFEINWNTRLYILPIRRIDARVYLEGMGTSFVYYSRPYPDGGSRVNIGCHSGLGMIYRINPELKGFTSLRLMHTSNGREYARNPAVNAVGIVAGLEF